MKTGLLLSSIILFSLSTQTSFSQEYITSTLSYDTTVIGTGSQYPPYSFTFPKFNGGLGTLSEVKIASVLTLNYSFTIENMNPGASTSKISINRSDEISGSTLSAPVSFDYAGPKTTYALGGSDGTSGSGPDWQYQSPIYIKNNDTIINETRFNTAAYIGAGTVNFLYGTDVGSVTYGNLNVAFNGQSSDNIIMSLTYVYSNPIVLASNITSFTASKNNRAVAISWKTSNENKEHSYELMKSTDGKNYTLVSKFGAAPDGNQVGNYQYNYVPQSNEGGKLYFRVKLIEAGAPIKYSALRSVELAANAARSLMRLYPNPVKGGEVKIAFTDTKPGNYDIQLFNIKGQVVKQMQISNAMQFKLNINGQFQPGDYFVMALNKKTGEKSVERLVIH